jgi:ubiquinone/menaquinone biosynthesis C-methylase UbiE
MTPPIRRHTDVLLETTGFAGRRMLDIGCGDGRLLGWAAAQGADPVGLDPQHGQLERARLSAPGQPLVRGHGECLPFASGRFDLVLCFNSLHHVPLEAQWQALAEASRVLATGGELVVVEPLAEGEHFALLRPVDDETEVRREAFRALHAAAALGLRMTRETFYGNLVVEASVVALRQRFLAIDASRAAALDRARDEVEHLFETLGRPVDGGRAFVQPMRLNRLQRQ